MDKRVADCQQRSALLGQWLDYLKTAVEFPSYGLPVVRWTTSYRSFGAPYRLSQVLLPCGEGRPDRDDCVAVPRLAAEAGGFELTPMPPAHERALRHYLDAEQSKVFEGETAPGLGNAVAGGFAEAENVRLAHESAVPAWLLPSGRVLRDVPAEAGLRSFSGCEINGDYRSGGVSCYSAWAR